jgi:hypothetical protein
VLNIGQIRSPVTGNGDSRQTAEKLLVWLKTTNNQNKTKNKKQKQKI